MAKVLIMDDEEVIRCVLQLMLNREGYETVTYPDAEPALAQVEFDAGLSRS